jgi:hypothetical protein
MNAGREERDITLQDVHVLFQQIFIGLSPQIRSYVTNKMEEIPDLKNREYMQQEINSLYSMLERNK